MRWKLRVKIAPRRLLCILDHRFGDRYPIIVDGPIMLDDGTIVPPRERDWAVLGMQRQCEKCYKIIDAEFTPEEAEMAIEAEILAEESEEDEEAEERED